MAEVTPISRELLVLFQLLFLIVIVIVVTFLKRFKFTSSLIRVSTIDILMPVIWVCVFQMGPFSPWRFLVPLNLLVVLVLMLLASSWRILRDPTLTYKKLLVFNWRINDLLLPLIWIINWGLIFINN